MFFYKIIQITKINLVSDSLTSRLLGFFILAFNTYIFSTETLKVVGAYDYAPFICNEIGDI